MNQTFRLPNGSLTLDVAEHVAVWESMIDALERRLDVKVLSFDPGFLVRTTDEPFVSVTLPMWLAERIISLAPGQDASSNDP